MEIFVYHHRSKICIDVNLLLHLFWEGVERLFTRSMLNFWVFFIEIEIKQNLTNKNQFKMRQIDQNVNFHQFLISVSVQTDPASVLVSDSEFFPLHWNRPEDAYDQATLDKNSLSIHLSVYSLTPRSSAPIDNDFSSTDWPNCSTYDSLLIPLTACALTPNAFHLWRE